MNESLFNDASPTNLLVVTSPISTYMQLPWHPNKFNLWSCAIRRFSYTQTECSYRTVLKKYTPWLLTVICCTLSAILLINPLNTVRLCLHNHQRSSALSSLSDCQTQPPNQNPGCFCLQLLSPSQKLKVRLFLSPCPLPYSSRFLIHVCSCMYGCQLK